MLSGYCAAACGNTLPIKTNLLALALAGSMLFFASCKKDSDSNNNNPTDTTKVDSALACRITTVTDSATTTASPAYAYDAQKRISKSTDITNDSAGPVTEITTYAHTANTITAITKNAAGVVQSTRVYTTAGGKLTGYIDTYSDTGVTYHDTSAFSYTGGNLTKVVDRYLMFNQNGDAAPFYSESTLTYDANNLPTLAITKDRDGTGGLVETGRSTFAYGNTPAVKINPVFEILPGYPVSLARKVPISETHTGDGGAYTIYYNATVNARGFVDKLRTTTVQTSGTERTTATYAYDCN